jgi:hypothetical protein
VVAALVTLSETIWLQFFAPNEAIESYKFGSDAMVSHGGWPYTSKFAYVAHGLFVGVVAAAAAAALAFSVFRRSRLSFLGYAAVALILLLQIGRCGS